ncbi:hypothetical protein NKH34_12170 [Mesorhizobium sp. M1148]|uniref:hypothetical protein n=1 Tax=unclassified Mesorhizobium TaxID=325217 RepID=UPI0033371C18
MPANENQKLTGKPDRLPFDYIKSQYFRVIRADGAIGSVTPNGHIHFALYSERAAIPRRLVQELSPAGELGALIPEATESRESIVREMDVDVFVTLEVARALHQWLGTHIQELSDRASPENESGGETQA